MDQVAVFHNFSKKEAVLKVAEPPSLWPIYVCYAGESRTDSSRGVDRDEGIPCPL